jgi:hypothetical protein
MKHCICFKQAAFVAVTVLGLALAPRVALANFHFMEIEQIIGGVNGDTSAQAVQLKMRLAGQQFVGGMAQLRVWDATGNNPIPLSTFPGSNPAGGQCLDILLATPNMANHTSPPLTAGTYYTMALIPASYLAGGSLTFEGVIGPTVYWRTSWGNYTGPQTVTAGVNDTDSSTAPPFASPLPASGTQALKLKLTCPVTSTDSSTDYTLSGSNAVLRNNAGTSFTVVLPITTLPGAAKWGLPAALALALLAFAVLRRRAA